MGASSDSMEDLLMQASGSDIEGQAQQLTDIITKQKEASAARRTYDEVAKAGTAELLDLQVQASQVQENSAAKQQELLGDMRTNLGRQDEIDNSLLLQVIEPIADTFNMRNYSRNLLQKDAKNKATELAIEDQQTQLAQGAVANKAREVDARIKSSQAQLASVTGDFTDLTQAMATTQDAVKSINATRAIAVEFAPDDKALDAMAASGQVPARQAAVEKRNRKNERINDSLQAAQVELTGIRMTEARLGQMTEQQLLDPATVQKYGAAPTQRAYQDSVQRTLAFQNAQILSEQTKAAEAARTQTDAELTKNPKASGNTDYSAQQTVKDRQAKQAQQTAEFEAQMANIGNLLVAHSTWDQLDAAYTEATAPGPSGKPSGIAMFKDADGRQIQVPLETVRKQLDLKSQAQGEAAMVQNSIETTTVAMQGVAQQIARMNGIELPPGTTLTDFLHSQIADTKSQPEERVAYSNILGQIEAASNPQRITDPVARLSLLTKAQANMVEVHANRRKSEIDAVPAPVQLGVAEYLKTGIINSNANAIPVISHFGMSRDPVGPKPYADAMTTLYNGTFAQKDKQQAAKDLMTQMSSKKLTPQQMLEERATHPDLQSSMATPILLDGLQTMHVQAAKSLGLNDLASSIQTGALFPNGQFDERMIANYLRSNVSPAGPVDLQKYLTALKQQTASVTKERTEPRGPRSALMAAVNQLLFNSDVGTYFQDYAVAGMQSGWKHSYNRNASESRAIDPSATNVLR